MGRMDRWELANDKKYFDFGIQPTKGVKNISELWDWKEIANNIQQLSDGWDISVKIQKSLIYPIKCNILYHLGYQKDNPTNNAPCYTSHGAPQGCRSCLPHPEAQGWCSQRWPKHTSRQGKPERDSRPRLTPFLDVDPRGCGAFSWANSFIHLSPQFLCSLDKYPNFPGLQSSLAPQFGHFKSPPPLASDRSTWIWT